MKTAKRPRFLSCVRMMGVSKESCASLNHRKKTKADDSQLIPRKHTERLVLLSVRMSLRQSPTRIHVLLKSKIDSIFHLGLGVSLCKIFFSALFSNSTLMSWNLRTSLKFCSKNEKVLLLNRKRLIALIQLIFLLMLLLYNKGALMSNLLQLTNCCKNRFS